MTGCWQSNSISLSQLLWEIHFTPLPLPPLSPPCLRHLSWIKINSKSKSNHTEWLCSHNAAQAEAFWNLWKKIGLRIVRLSAGKKYYHMKWLRNQRSNLQIWWNCNTIISSRLTNFFYLVGVSIALLTKENRNNCNKNSLVFSRTAKSSFIHLATFSLINHWNNLQFVMWKLISCRGFLKSSELLYNFLVSLSIFFTNWKRARWKLPWKYHFPLCILWKPWSCRLSMFLEMYLVLASL